MSKFHEIDGGRRGYFLVVSEGGTESDCLTPACANSEADGIVGPKAIWWQFLDEQPKPADGAGWSRKEPVRHFVADVQREPRDPKKHYLRPEIDDPCVGVWQACEAYLIAGATRVPDAGLKGRKGP